uniref:Uncharacterized protein n=1 Tax=Lygus hesperus TaxID=30085 RepID=A0A0A9Y2F5_LYGHE
MSGKELHRSCTCGLHHKWPEEQKVQVVSKEPQYSQEPPKIQKTVSLPRKSSIHEKLPASRKPSNPQTPSKPVTQKKVVSREDDSRQMQAASSSLDGPLLSLHKKDILNKGTTHQRRHTDIPVERRRSSWEFFLESKKLRKLKKKREKQEEKIKKKNEMKKKKTIVKHARRSFKNRFFRGLMNAFGFKNKSQDRKKAKNNRELYPLDEFCSRSSKPFRMNIQ